MAASPATVAPNTVMLQSILSNFDAIKPEVYNQLIRKYGDQGLNIYQWLWSRGLEFPTANDAFIHYEDDWKTDVVTIRANSVAGSTGALTVVPIVDVSGKVYVRVGDNVLFKGTTGIHGVRARVYALDQTAGAATMTVAPYDSTLAIPAVTLGEQVMIYTNSFAEATGQPIGRYSGFSKVTNYVQIIKESFGISGSALTDQLWFEVPNASGTGVMGYAAKGQLDMDFRYAKQVDGAFLVGTKNTNTTVNVDAVTGGEITSTEGLFTGLKTSGKTLGYTTTFELADFNTIDKYQTTQYVGGNSLFGMGIDLDQSVEDKLFSTLKQTGFDPTEITQGIVNDLFGGSRNTAMSLGFNSFRKSDRTYIFKRLSGLSDLKSFGATGYNWSKVGFLLPNDKQTDPKSKEKLDSMRTRYKALGSYNRKLEAWNLGGAGGGTYVSDVDANNLYMRGHVGLELFGLNRFVIVEPA